MNALQQKAQGVSIPLVASLTKGFGPIFVALALTVVIHLVIGPAIGPYWSKILLDIGINVILAVSLNVVNGFTGQFSIGHAGFMALGGYTSGLFTYYGGLALWGNNLPHGSRDYAYSAMFGPGTPLFVGGALAGAVVAGLFGYIVGLPSLRLRGDYLALVTLGFGEIVRVLITLTPNVLSAKDFAKTPAIDVPLHVGGSLGFTGLPFYTNLFWVWFFVSATVLIAFRLKESTHGRAFLAIREDEIAAEAMGIPTTRLKIRAFVLSAAMAGIAGAMFAHETGVTLNPKELSFQRSFEVVIMVVLGGMGSISGAILAAFVLTILPELLREFNEYRMIVYALTLIVMMIVRPQGLLGLQEIWETKLGRRLFGRKR